MPPIKDSDDEVVCFLCHGSGKTTGRILFAFRDTIFGHLHHQLTTARSETCKVFLKRLFTSQAEFDEREERS